MKISEGEYGFYSILLNSNYLSVTQTFKIIDIVTGQNSAFSDWKRGLDSIEHNSDFDSDSWKRSFDPIGYDSGDKFLPGDCFTKRAEFILIIYVLGEETSLK